MLQDGPSVTHYERLAAFLSTLSHWHSHKKHMNVVQAFACICHASTLSRLGHGQIINCSRFCWIVLYHVRKPKILCMITKLQCTCLNGQCRYACSKLAQQRLTLQDEPRVRHYERPAAFLSTLSHWRSHKKQMNLVQVCHASTLSRLGQRQISCWIVQDFAEYFCAVSAKESLPEY